MNKTMHSFEVRKSPNIEPLLFHIERSQLSRFGHARRMPQETLFEQVLFAK